jgi:Protein of unknown function (DUF3040)
MLSDDDIQALHQIERRLRWHSAELVRLFHSVEPQPEAKHRQRARARALLAALAVTGVALLAPRMLNEAEVRTRRRQPLPLTAPAGPIPVKDAVADILLAPSTTQATSSRHGPYADLGDGRPLDRLPVHVESLSREALTGRQITLRARRRAPAAKARAELERK